MPTFHVETPPAPYDVVVERGILQHAAKYVPPKAGKVFVVSTDDVWRHQCARLENGLAAIPHEVLFLPGGEDQKRLDPIERLAEEMVRLGGDRSSVVVAFGGGIVTDMAGFLAAIFMRGVPVVQIPTTLLAQVDAAIGGKTGVNLASGKNLLGTFHQPRAVLIDPAVLETLPSREYCAGLYESLKCGIIGDPGLFRLFEDRRREILDRDPVLVEKVIADSVLLKASVVSADEREGGLRQVLNFGHTIGHALEAETGYTQLLHGEAVAWGMIAATHIALSTGKLDSVTAGRITNAVLGFGRLPRMKLQTASILKRLRSDKKMRQGVVHFILPREIGKVEITRDVPEAIVRSAIDEIRKLARS